MNVASLELCKELYELSGWVVTDSQYLQFDIGPMSVHTDDVQKYRDRAPDKILWLCPAYDLGYLLRKLPVATSVYKHSKLKFNGHFYKATDFTADVSCEADTPEDAAAKLAIELFKQGVLTK